MPKQDQLREELLKQALAEHQRREQQDFREYASFVPKDAKIIVKEWPKL